MASLVDAAEEFRQADELRSRANILRQLGADELAREFKAIALIEERKAYAITRMNLPSSDTVLIQVHDSIN